MNEKAQRLLNIVAILVCGSRQKYAELDSDCVVLAVTSQNSRTGIIKLTFMRDRSVMKAVGKLYSREPEWILDRTGSGPLFWRRESNETKSRVKFRYEVDIKEFQRAAHELEDTHWFEQGTNLLTSGLCVVFCFSATVFLPWFLLISRN